MDIELYDPALLTTFLGATIKALSTGVLLTVVYSMVFRIKSTGGP